MGIIPFNPESWGYSKKATSFINIPSINKTTVGILIFFYDGAFVSTPTI